MERPEYYCCNEEGSFAQLTYRVRLPDIVRRTVASWGSMHSAHTAAVASVEAALLADEPLCAVPSLPHFPLRAELPWSHYAFLHVETYLYALLLHRFGYHDSSADTYRVDIFKPQKTAARQQCEEAMKAVLLEEQDSNADTAARLLASFWGNRTDLSLHALHQTSVHRSGLQQHILVNDCAAIAALLDALPAGRQVDIIVDNYCFELFTDLLLAKHLLRKGLRVCIHCKAHPIFVSDAVLADCRELADELQLGPDIVLRDDEYWNSHFEFFEGMPDALQEHFRKSSLVIVKGDANYRKLVGERKYAVDTPFATVVDYFPAPAIAALRGLKCDCVVGVPRNVAEREQKENSAWRTDGSRGVIQLHVKK